jgi:Glycosyl hydrolases family 25
MNKSLNCAAAVVSAALAATSAYAADRILGVDVSSSQGSINWADVYANGVTFAYIHAVTGAGSVDPDFTNNILNAKAAGLQAGAYQVSRLDIDTPSEEATYFWNHAGAYIKFDGKSISPAITFEIFDGYDGASSYTAWFNQWGTDLKAKTASFMHPVIYVNPCSGACLLTTNIGLAAWVGVYNGQDPYTGNPWGSCDACNAWDPDGTGGWSFWQFSDTGAIEGISGAVDLDVFNGDLAQLKSGFGLGD